VTIVARDPQSAIIPLTVSDVARAAVRAGICVLPPRQDGSKAPDVTSWREFQRRLPTQRELDHWYGDPRRSGIIFVCGRVSGGLELLDFDDRASAWDAYQSLVDDNGLRDVWDRVTGGYLERTPGGGYHVLFRSSNPTGALKLAQRPKRPEEKQHERDNWQVLIETKGEGGYVVAAPTNGSVHPAGGSYDLLQGGLDAIATITTEERDSLLAVARMLDQKPRPVYGTEAGAVEGKEEAGRAKPGDCYNASTSWEELLPHYGWRMWKRQGRTTHWTRPGKVEGISATTNHQGKDLLHVFTSSTELDPDRSYDRFAFYATMELGGDFRAAARALGEQGYGAPDPDPTPRRTPSGTFGTDTDTEPSRAVSWPLMANLPALIPPVPTMSADMIPEPFRARVVDVADLTKVPLEMVGAPMVGAAGAVIGRGIGIRPWPYSDFVTVPNLWGAVIARPGWIKSGSVGEALSLLGRLAKAERTLHEAADQRLAVRRERIAAEIDAIKRAMRDAARTGGEKDRGNEKKTETESTPLDALEDALRGKLAELKSASRTERRYLTHDATVEKLGALLTDNPRGMLVLRDELSGWLRALDKPGREGDREFYLEAWNGTGSYTVDRIGRGTIHISSLTLSVFGGIQPGKLQALVASAIHGGFGDDGLLQRFQLNVWPDQLPPWVKPTLWPDNEARERVNTVFGFLAAMVDETVGATNDDIPYLRFSPSAQTIADDWRDTLEHRLRSGALDDTSAFASHIAKYRSLMPELALIFALIEMAAKVPGTSRGAVSEQHVRLSIRWCAFLEAHARKIYTEEMNSSLSAAHALAEKIRAGAVVDGQTVRDLYRHHWAGLRTPERVLAALIELTDLGWVRIDYVLTGGRSSPVVRLHPDLLETSAPDDSDGEA
jgi:hypothetical protein